MPDDSREMRPDKPCPICGKAAEVAWRPFCSKRCGNVDLGHWLGGHYAIPGEPTDVLTESEVDETG